MQRLRKRKLYVKILLWSVALLFLAAATFENFHTCPVCPCCGTALDGGQEECPYWCDCDQCATAPVEFYGPAVPEKVPCPGCEKDKNPNIQPQVRIVPALETLLTLPDAPRVPPPDLENPDPAPKRGPPTR